MRRYFCVALLRMEASKRILILWILVWGGYARITYLPVDVFPGFATEPRLELSVDLQGKWEVVQGDVRTPVFVPFNADIEELVIRKFFDVREFSGDYFYLYVPAVSGKCEVYINGRLFYVQREGFGRVFVPVRRKYLLPAGNELRVKFKRSERKLKYFYSNIYSGFLSGVYLLRSCVSLRDLDLNFLCVPRVGSGERVKVVFPYDAYFGYYMVGGKEGDTLYFGEYPVRCKETTENYYEVLFDDLQNFQELCVEQVGAESYFKKQCYVSYTYKDFHLVTDARASLGFLLFFMLGAVLVKVLRLYRGITSFNNIELLGIWLVRWVGFGYLWYFLGEYIEGLREHYWDVSFSYFRLNFDYKHLLFSVFLYDAYRFLANRLWFFLFRSGGTGEALLVHLYSDILFPLAGFVIYFLGLQGVGAQHLLIIGGVFLLIKYLYTGIMLWKLFGWESYRVILYICTLEVVALKILYTIISL